MLSRTKYTQLAAVAALAIALATGASLTSAQAQGGTNPQMEKQQTGSDTRSGEKNRDAGSARETSREGGWDRGSGTTREMRSDRSRDRTSSQTTVRRDNDRSRVTVRGRDYDRDHNWRWRGRSSYGATTFVVLGERRHYRPGWCRGLHRGHHFAPGAGEHAGKHFGLFRC